MAKAIPHPAANFVFGPPPGEADRVESLAVFITTNLQQTQITSVTSAWELTDAEIDEIVRTRRVMMNTLGGGLMAHYISSESSCREFASGFGKTW